MNHDQEITKLLAKVMHNSYKRKEVNECIYRIFYKMEKIINTDNLDEDIKHLKDEYSAILKEINKYMS